MEWQKTENEYAALYNVSPRTVRRWKAKGWNLDDEEEIRLLIAEGGRAGAGTGSESESTDSPRRPEGLGAVGLQAALERLRYQERDAHAAYLAACEEGSESVVAARQKQWLALQKALLEAEKANPDVAEANKNSISLGEIKTVLTGLFNQLRQDLEAMPRRLETELAGQDAITIREGIAREVATIIGNLYACHYLQTEEEENEKRGAGAQ